MTLESAVPGDKSLKTKDVSYIIIHLDINRLRTTFQHNSKLDIHPTTPTIVEKNAIKSNTSHCNTMSINSTR